MKRILQAAMLVASVVVVAACSPTEYIISTTDGTMITTSGQPKLDEETGMYKYEDAEGRDATIRKEDVKQIMER
ncbi:MAG: YgdI/YgdR family lipoprotein [Gammaproteobacteria bacterium]|nr:YgdI/YgdR family lipoprotein [Gammaproteobacteria bacterium]